MVTVREQRMKRLLECLQASINMNGTYDLEAINSTLDEEFKTYLSLISGKAQAARSALLVSYGLDSRDSKTLDRIKQVYRELVKKLHPDLNENQSQDDYAAFLAVQRAYKSNDLEALLSWQILYKGTPDALLNADELLDRRLVLIAKIDNMKKWFKEISNEFPFNKEALLSDEEQIKVEQERLESDLEVANSRCSRYIEDILGTLTKEDLNDLDSSWFDDEEYGSIIEARLDEMDLECQES